MFVCFPGGKKRYTAPALRSVLKVNIQPTARKPDAETSTDPLDLLKISFNVTKFAAQSPPVTSLANHVSPCRGEWLLFSEIIYVD